MLLPYLYSKRGATPEPAPLRFTETPLELQRPGSIQQAINNIAHIFELQASGKLDLDTGNDLVASNKAFIDGIVDHEKLLAQGQNTGEQTIHITGGLPALPGTNITMPQVPMANTPMDTRSRHRSSGAGD